MKKDIINFEKIKIASIFAVSIAKVAQLVEHDLAKVGVAGSNPVFRSALNDIREKNEDNSFQINRLEAIFF